MSKSIVIRMPFKGCSFQQGHMRYKTPKQKAFEAAIAKELFPRIGELKNFASGYDPKTEVLTTNWVFLYKNFFTKKENTISAQTLDLDNSIKNVQDCIFKHLPGMNDSQIVFSDSFKWESPEDGIICKINILKREEIENIIEKYQ